MIASACLGCGREFDGPGLQCPDCRDGRTPSATLEAAPKEVRRALKKSEAEIRLEIKRWYRIVKGWEVIDTEQERESRVDAGLSDLIVFPQPGRVRWIEVKSETGKQRDSQRRFEAICRAAGEIYLLVRSLEEVQRFEAESLT